MILVYLVYSVTLQDLFSVMLDKVRLLLLLTLYAHINNDLSLSSL
jgi:hypothetical protein